MLVFATLSPDVFTQTNFENPSFRDQVVMFFRSLESNASLLLDHDGYLLEKIQAKVNGLTIKYQQDLNIRLDELRKCMKNKKTRRRVVKCNIENCRYDHRQSSQSICDSISRATSLDALFVTPVDDPASQSNEHIPFRNLAEYMYSDFEEKRRFYMEQLPPIDQLNTFEFDELIARATKYSVYLRFFDKQIGTGKGVSKFRMGIEKIVNVWVENCHFSPDFIEVVTVESDSIKQGDGTHISEEKHEKSAENFRKVNEYLIDCLKSKFGISVRFSLKQDPDKMMHARHLQTQTATILFERGFDFIGEKGQLKRSIVKWDQSAEHHIQEARSLIDSECMK